MALQTSGIGNKTLLFVVQLISEIQLYVKFLKTLYVVEGVSTGFWGSTVRRGGIGDAGKVFEIHVIFADFGGVPVLFDLAGKQVRPAGSEDVTEPVIGPGEENGFHDAAFILEGDEFHGVAGPGPVATGKTPTTNHLLYD
jgi:hypothetical protein